jgi:hypothetical protein
MDFTTIGGLQRTVGIACQTVKLLLVPPKQATHTNFAISATNRTNTAYNDMLSILSII